MIASIAISAPDVPLLVATRCLSMIASIALSARNLPFVIKQVISSKQETVLHLTFVGVRAAVQMRHRDFKVSRLRKMSIDTAFAILRLGVTRVTFTVDKSFPKSSPVDPIKRTIELDEETRK
jgi:hypothetical protein